jgi:hypothetical protein
MSSRRREWLWKWNCPRHFNRSAPEEAPIATQSPLPLGRRFPQRRPSLVKRQHPPSLRCLRSAHCNWAALESCAYRRHGLIANESRIALSRPKNRGSVAKMSHAAILPFDWDRKVRAFCMATGKIVEINYRLTMADSAAPGKGNRRKVPAAESNEAQSRATTFGGWFRQ